MTTRRGFLTGMLALGAASAIVRASSLMPILVPPQTLVIGRYEGFRFITSPVLPDELTHYEDGIPDVMLRQMAERMALRRDMILYGVLKTHG